MAEQKSRNWVFTFNNYPTNLVEFNSVLQANCRYYIYGKEVGESGTHHLQGYCVFKSPRVLNGIKKCFPSGVHWEKRKGTHEQAKNYCIKEGKSELITEWGDEPKQGRRTDLIEIKNNIINGLKVDTIVMENPIVFHQYGRTLNKIEDLVARKKYRTTMTEGIWYWGDTGVGKSHKAFENYNPDTHYLLPNDNGWWDGYTQQPTVIINDFRGEIPYNELLQLIDKWPFQVRRRNREPMPFTSTKIIITSSLHPKDIYKKRMISDKIEQLLRRVTIIRLHEPVAERNTSGGGGNTNPPTYLDLDNNLDSNTITNILTNELKGY